VPEVVEFLTKPEIALAQVKAAQAAGTPGGIVLADAGYGNDTGFRDGLTEIGARYVVGVQGTTSVWAPGQQPLPPKPWSGVGRKPRLLRRDADHQLVSVKALAMGLPATDYRTINWRAGSNTDLSSRFAAVRVRAAHRDHWRAELRDKEWLLIEWPEGKSEPEKYVLSTLPADTALERLVAVTKMRWRIERDYQDLKQEFGLAHYEGRGWRGFLHHATLCIAAYGFLVAERLRHKDTKKTPYSARNLPYPKITCHGAVRRPQRHVPNSISTLRWIIAQMLANSLQRCPCCAQKRGKLTLHFSDTVRLAGR